MNYALLTQAMGIEGIVIETPEELDRLCYDNLFTKDDPTLINVRIDRQEVPPTRDRIKGLTVNASATPGG